MPEPYTPEQLKEQPWLVGVEPHILMPHVTKRREAAAKKKWEEQQRLQQIGPYQLLAEYYKIYQQNPDVAAKLLAQAPELAVIIDRIPYNPIFVYQPFDTDHTVMPDGNRKSSPVEFHQDDSVIRVVVTGNRCSKTYSGAADVICHCIGIDPITKQAIPNHTPQPYWVVSDTEDASKQIVQATYHDLIPQDLLADTSEYSVERGWVGNRVTFKNGSQIEFRFSSQGRATFQGTYRNIHLDEEPPKEIYLECFARTTPVGGRPRGRILITFTPIYNPRVGISWIHTDLYARRHSIPGLSFHFWTLYDVPEHIIPTDQKEEVIASYDEDERDVRVLGQFTPVGMTLAFASKLIGEQREHHAREGQFYEIESQMVKKAIPVKEVKYLPKDQKAPTTTEEEEVFVAVPAPDDGEVTIFEHPVAGRKYAIGADPSQGLAHGDFATVCVIDRQTFSQVAEVQCKLDPDEFGDLLLRLGTYYNYAYIGIENVADLTPIYYLNNAEYPNLHYQCVIDGRVYDRTTDKIGWNTNTKTRRILRNDALQMLRDGSVRIVSHRLLDEMEIFARNPKGRWEAIAGGHDDLVFGWMIAIQMVKCADIVDDWRDEGLLDRIHEGGQVAYDEVRNDLPAELADVPTMGSNEARLARFIDSRIQQQRDMEVNH